MKYFKNTELAKLYNVSEKSVRNWIDAAQDGKIDLELNEENGKFYIASTSKNSAVIENLVEKGKKYRNSRGYKLITPGSKFYEIYNSKEIFDIISNLDSYREMPVQYSYFDGGAAVWDNYVQRLAVEDGPNNLTNTINLLSDITGYIDKLLEDYKYINIIDIGPGNCFPVRKLLEQYSDTGRLNRYIALDISRDMLNIAEKNIQSWFGDKVNFEGHLRDINYERFSDLLATDSFEKEEEKVRNIILCFGNTISNFREPEQPLTIIHESMGKEDLLVFAKQLDTANARRYFDYGTGTGVASPLPPKSKFTIDLLNIDESLYDAKLYFDEDRMARRLEIELKVALSIEFQLEGKPKIINFNKGETILLWRHNHQDTLHSIIQLDNCGFSLQGAVTSPDGECLLSISKIKAMPS